MSYTPPQVAALYDFPTGVDGTGECIALIELGGGYNTTDLSSYWSQLKLTETPERIGGFGGQRQQQSHRRSERAGWRSDVGY